MSAPPPPSDPATRNLSAPLGALGRAGWFSPRRLRQYHLYLGVFFAPLLLFFIGTGWYQVNNRDRLKDPSEAETLVQKFRVVHTDQIYPSEQEFKKRSSPRVFGVFVGVMSGAMILTTALGLLLAFRTGKSAVPAVAALLLGLLVPVILLWLGQQH